MDSFFIAQSTQDSRQYRSRSNSHLSSTAEQFQGLNIDPSDRGGNGQNPALPSDFQAISPPTYLKSTSHSEQESFIPAPIPQQSTPFPLLSESDLDPNWSYLTASEDHSGSAPLLTLDPPESCPEEQHQPFSDRRSIRSNSNPGTMRSDRLAPSSKPVN
jgi:hypothetical protein